MKKVPFCIYRHSWWNVWHTNLYFAAPSTVATEGHFWQFVLWDWNRVCAEKAGMGLLTANLGYQEEGWCPEAGFSLLVGYSVAVIKALTVQCLAVGLRCLWGRSSWPCATLPSGRASSCWSTAAGNACGGSQREEFSELCQSSSKAVAEPCAAGDALVLAGFQLCSLSAPSSGQCQQQVRERTQRVVLAAVEMLPLSPTQNFLWTALTAGVCLGVLG